jgi:hypothetical protein
VSLVFFLFLLVVALVHRRWWETAVGLLGALTVGIQLRTIARREPKAN